MSKETKSLAVAYQEELARLNRAVGIYESLPGGVGFFGAAFIKDTINRATNALNNGDTVAMLALYEEMKNTAEDC